MNRKFCVYLSQNSRPPFETEKIKEISNILRRHWYYFFHHGTQIFLFLTHVLCLNTPCGASFFSFLVEAERVFSFEIVPSHNRNLFAIKIVPFLFPWTVRTKVERSIFFFLLHKMNDSVLKERKKK
jgi:hypothetical protein